MSKEEVKKVFEALRADPKTKELIGACEAPETPEEVMEIYAQVAKKLGFDVTSEELGSYIKELEEGRKARTREDVREIQNLDDEELDQVAGGSKEHNSCEDTYRDKENCWYTDGCDNIWNIYDDYVCHIVSSCQQKQNDDWNELCSNTIIRPQ